MFYLTHTRPDCEYIQDGDLIMQGKSDIKVVTIITAETCKETIKKRGD